MPFYLPYTPAQNFYCKEAFPGLGIKEYCGYGSSILKKNQIRTSRRRTPNFANNNGKLSLISVLFSTIVNCVLFS
jgi:hypothetical protein